MKTITLADGSRVLLDDADYAWAERYRWHQGNGYARRTDRSSGEPRPVYLHREITGASLGDQVDHIDGDRLNCARENLRVVPAAVNEYNKPASRRSSTGVRGVYARQGRYRAIVGNRCLGTHATPEAAHAAVLAELTSRAQGHAIPRA